MFNELPNELADLADQTPQAKRVAITKRLSQYETENVTWMWNPYLPNGKLVIIGGILVLVRALSLVKLHPLQQRAGHTLVAHPIKQ